MRLSLVLFFFIVFPLTGFAQTDTTAKQSPDTIKIGGMVIIREPGANMDTIKKKDKI